MTTAKAIKTIRSHSGYARFLAGMDGLETDSEGMPLVVRSIPRRDDIASPYSYSPEWDVFRYKGRDVVLRETAQRCYQVFAV